MPGDHGAADHPAAEAGPFVGLASAGRSEVIIRKSRFLGFAWPVRDAAEAEEFVENLRAEHREARHVCFAYRVGLDREEVRSSDDGEPSGTAGRPILEVILQRDIRCAAVAVVRYFGGILLGAPGLVRAYSQAAALALDDAGTVEMAPHTGAVFIMPYSVLGKFRHLLQEAGGREEEARYGEHVELEAWIPAEGWASFLRRLEPFGGEVAVKPFPDVRYRPRDGA